jgi:hypothetical protein
MRGIGGRGAVENGQWWWWGGREQSGRGWCQLERMGIRRVKRILWFLAQIGVLVGGVMLALGLGVLVESNRGDLGGLVFLVGGLASLAGFVLLVRRNAARRVQYDAEDYPVEKANRKLHPRRERRKRIARRVLVWLPSGIVAFVLFYFPQATHIVHRWATQVGPYRVPIPWRFVILPVPNQQNAIWAFGKFRKQGPGDLTRMWISSSPGASWRSVEGGDLMIGSIPLSCKELVNIRRKEMKSVQCRTLPQAQGWNFYAGFSGDDEDRAAFNEILRGVR